MSTAERDHANSAERVWPSETFLSRLNAAADTDVTVLLRCSSPAEATAVAAAVVRAGDKPAANAVGRRARLLEARQRRPATIGSIRLDDQVGRAGPVDVGRVPADPQMVVLRWSHLAGDGRSCRDYLLEALAGGGLLDRGAGCGCARLPPDGRRPMVAADAWRATRRPGLGALLDVARSAPPAVAPLLRRAVTDLGEPTRPPIEPSRPLCEAGADGDAVAVVTMPRHRTGPGSRVAQIAHAVSAVVDGTGRDRTRVGVTVDLRRHEPGLPAVETGGNLSLVGWVTFPAHAADATAVHAAIQQLLRRRFWRQQLAFDLWLGGLPGPIVARACDRLIHQMAGRAPITVTELWRDDLPVCPACGGAPGALPPTISPVVIPPALPPAGLVAGITCTQKSTVVALRRVTRPGSSAAAWTAERAGRLPGELTMCGPVTYR